MFKRIILGAANLMEKGFQQNEIIAERYRIISHLGTGSYGNSYLVMDQVSQQQKVLKALRIHKRIKKSGKKGFELEKTILKSLKHPGFPQYYEDGIYKSIPFYTMEYMKGKNFEQLIFQDGQKYTEIEAFVIAYKLLELIHYLHEHRLIHRDIRIPNVIADDSRIALIDLGLTRKCGHDRDNQTKRNLGKEVNPQADFFGLGHFLLFLLYSNYTFPKNQKESSWEEELAISLHAKHIISRLLQLRECYESCAQVKSDMKLLIEK
ncbi:protein kinase [Neobacillus sp. DY30]|uniref:serine/threonine protein kinase n=1 Tax=Neobacillus sp. DY30 TaxID=3047871 RepID=UPI0024BFF924|nr:protein kinase [Neobacillus sp. DY30]WHX98939.1 protein kinase [Neobacillus sp. DY30]